MRNIYEEVTPTAYTDRGVMNIDDPAVRDNINTLLTGSMKSCKLTPYIALEKVRKVLAYFHIHLHATPFMEGDHGVQVFNVNQFNSLYGMKDNGEVVTKNEDTNPYYVYFEYRQNDKGMFDIFCQLVTEDEMHDLTDAGGKSLSDDEPTDDREDRLEENKKEIPIAANYSKEPEESSKKIPITDVWKHLGEIRRKKSMKTESSESVTLAGPETGAKRIPGSPEVCTAAKMLAVKILSKKKFKD